MIMDYYFKTIIPLPLHVTLLQVILCFAYIYLIY